jgi:hypothetical protein
MVARLLQPISTLREAHRLHMSWRQPASAILAAALVAFAPAADAKVTGISFTVVSPAFAGRSFGAVGQYEKLTGTITGEVDPADPHNAGITDIALAPRTPRGTVAYSTTFTILRPINPAAGSHELIYEVNNRGTKNMVGVFNTFSSATNTNANDPTTAKDAGDGWLMQRGYTLAWSGWDGLLPKTGGLETVTVPVATNRNGTPVTGRALEEWAIIGPGIKASQLTYPAADDQDTTTAQLTVREHYADTPMAVAGWRYINNGHAVALAGDAAFTQGRLYEFAYTAQQPLVEGLGFAAVRDVVIFLRHGEPGVASPLGHDIATAIAVGFSQSARFLRDFVHLGFNRAETGAQVFDGIENAVAGGNGVFLNYRFAQPSRTERQHTDRWYPEGLFPFAWQVTTDPITGATGGRLQLCDATATCPKIIETLSENEYWAKAASLLTTDPTGTRDLAPSRFVRLYLFASHQHGAARGLGICAQPQNPLWSNAGIRALLNDLDDWLLHDTPAPANRVPMLADGTLAPPALRDRVKFPAIPGVEYNGRATIRNARDFGPQAAAGILTTLPPAYVGTTNPAATSGPGIYPSYVPVDDADGLDVAGIRLPDIAVPVATFTGWGLQAADEAAGDGCEGSGQLLALPATAAAAKAAGDPRRSLAERYPTHAAYVAAVQAGALALQAQRLLLPEDVANYLAAAELSTAGTGAATPPQPLAE